MSDVLFWQKIRNVKELFITFTQGEKKVSSVNCIFETKNANERTENKNIILNEQNSSG